MARKVKRYTQEEKEKYIKDYKESKLSITQYIKKANIPEATFRGWITKENMQIFGEVKLDENTTNQIENESSIIFEMEKIKIELKKGYNKKILKSLMEVLIDNVN